MVSDPNALGGTLMSIDSTSRFNVFFDYETFFNKKHIKIVSTTILENMLMISLYLHFYYKPEFKMRVQERVDEPKIKHSTLGVKSISH